MQLVSRLLCYLSNLIVRHDTDECIIKRCSLAQRFELKFEIIYSSHTWHTATVGVTTFGDHIMSTTPDASDGKPVTYCSHSTTLILVKVAV